MRKWLPYARIDDPGVWTTVVNMLPQQSGAYAPPNLFVQYVGAGPATPGTTLRWWSVLLADDSATSYVGTTTKLWQMGTGLTFTDRSGAVYTNTATDWSFAQYGNISFATNRVNNVQTRDSTGGSNFADATGAPPKARIVVTQADQVLLFDLNDGAEKPDAFATCAPGDHTDWSGAGATTATRIRHRPGKITAAVAFRDYVLVFKQNSIYRLTYTGNSTFKWKVELIAIGRGAFGQHNVVNCGDVVVFMGPGGGWLYDGASFRSITERFGEFDDSVQVASGSFFMASSQSAYFHITDTYYVYNLVSDAWGRQQATSTTAVMANTYRPLTGDPAALRGFSGGVIGSTLSGYPDVTWKIDLSLNPCMMGSNTRWGGGAAASASAYLSGSLEGAGGNYITHYSGADLEFAPTVYAVNQFTPPSNTECFVTLYQADSPLGPLAIAAQYPSGVASSTAHRRFDFQVACAYVRPVFGFGADSGYFEVADYSLIKKPSGKG